MGKGPGRGEDVVAPRIHPKTLVEIAQKSFIDSAFTAINTRKSANLIIDLRNNPGGDDAFSDYLVGYLARQPFQWNSSFRLKTSEALKAHIRAKQDTAAAFWKQALTRAVRTWPS